MNPGSVWGLPFTRTIADLTGADNSAKSPKYIICDNLREKITNFILMFTTMEKEIITAIALGIGLSAKTPIL